MSSVVTIFTGAESLKPDLEQDDPMEQSYKFHLSPEWEIEVSVDAMKAKGCFPHGPLLSSRETRILLLEAALMSEQANDQTQ